MITCEIVNLDEFRREWHRAELAIGTGTQLAVERGVKEGAAEALSTRRWKDRTGKTRENTRGVVEFKVPGGALGYIEVAVPHASYLAEGTEEHVIRPKFSDIGPLQKSQGRRAKTDIGTHRVALRWYDAGGQVHFAAAVHHPGTAADPFFANAYLKCERVAIREVEIGVAVAQRILDE